MTKKQIEAKIRATKKMMENAKPSLSTTKVRQAYQRLDALIIELSNATK